MNVVDVTTATRIGLIWSEAPFDGGDPVIDFRLWYDEGSNGANFVVLVESLTQPQYTLENVVTGSTYQFKLQASNLYGHSPFSQVVSILAAQKPEVPIVPTTSFADGQVTISWTPPNNGGSEITLYSVIILKSDGTY